MKTVEETAPSLGVVQACEALGIPRATYYRWLQARRQAEEVAAAVAEHAPKPQSAHPRALSEAERAEVRSVLNSDRFMDSAPAQVYATLLDEGRYLCSERTM